MGVIDERKAGEWYEASVRCYVQRHQGCARCGEQHCVLRSEWGTRVEFHCARCDFSACHDSCSGRYFASGGDEMGLLGVALGLTDAEQPVG